MALLWASAPSLCAWAPSARCEHSALVAPGPQAQTLSPGIASHHITIHHTSSHVPPHACNAGAEPDDFGLPSKARPRIHRSYHISFASSLHLPTTSCACRKPLKLPCSRCQSSTIVQSCTGSCLEPFQHSHGSFAARHPFERPALLASGSSL